MPISLTPVESSQIAAIGHDPATNTLAIRFKAKNGPGSLSHYNNVSADDFAEFQGAKSIGAHFGKVIKPAVDKYPFSRVNEDEQDGGQ